MSQTTDQYTAIAQDLGTTVVGLAQDAVATVGEFGSSLVDSGLKLLQDAGVVDKPKRGGLKRTFLAVLIIVIGGAIAFKVLKGRGAATSEPSLPEADRLADATGVTVS